MPTIDHRRRLRSLAALALGALLLAAPAAAQSGLPDDLPRAQTLNSTQVEQIRAFATRQLDALKSGDIARVQQARDVLLRTLETGDVSVAFRLRMSEALSPELNDIARRPDEHLAFNALRIAGALATDAAVDIMRRSLADPRASVRYGAALAARLTIDAVATRRSPLPQNQLDALVAALKDALAAEKDSEVFGGLVAAMNSVDPNGPGRTRALTDLSRIMGERFAADAAAEPAPDWARTYQRAFGAAQNAVAAQLSGGALDRSFAKALAGAAGQALAYTARRLNAPGDMPETERSALRDLVASAEFALLLIDADLGRRSQDNRLLLQAFEATAEKGPQPFLDEAARWIGPQGFLTKDPYDRATFKLSR